MRLLQGARADSMTAPRVSGIVVNYRTPDLTIRAGESLVADGVQELVVVENGSGDDSLERLRAFADASTSTNLIEVPDNLGFGQGANLGAEAASGDFVFFLNSDASVEPGCTDGLIDVL